MATLRAARPSIPSYTKFRLPQRRTFLPNPFEALSSATSNQPPAPQILTACRTLPYPSAPVYSIIADVPSYSTFLPYCQQSQITKWSAPDKQYNRRWPSEGILTSGFGGITESFVSRVYCVPGRYVESVGGNTGTSLREDDIAHHLSSQEQDQDVSSRKEGSNGLLTHLRSTWTVEAIQNGQTQVSLAVEFAFANPMYAALSGGVAPKVAEFMVKAFEKRVREVLERNPEMVEAGLEDMEGSGMKR